MTEENGRTDGRTPKNRTKNSETAAGGLAQVGANGELESSSAIQPHLRQAAHDLVGSVLSYSSVTIPR